MALYRTYRPTSFDDVVGQDHVVRLLRNAVKRGKPAHAYLLCGPRGTGKTTLARLLACALNAPAGPDPDFDPAAEPLPRILNGTSLDLVVEINAAQNNGIDDVRELQRSASLAPSQGATKVYILDEAHAMSNAAASALLKLLEEPPANVVFVLCTTEPDKLLATIDSRCQVLAMRRPSLVQLAQPLRRIADAEGIQITDGALRLCARAASGAFRDAIGELEKVATAIDGPVDEDAAAQVLGVVGDEIAAKLTQAVVDQDAAALMQGVEELAIGGHDLALCADALIAWMRVIYLRQLTGDIRADDDPGPQRRATLQAQADALSLADTLGCVDWLAGAQRDIKSGVEARVALEVALLRCAQREQQLPVRVARLERAAA